MSETIGFIGTGIMGGAVLKAAAKNAPDAQFLLSNRTEEKARALQRTLAHAEVVKNAEVAARAERIFLCVKPQVLPSVLAEIAPVLKDRTDRFILISMAFLSKDRNLGGNALSSANLKNPLMLCT